MLLFHTEGVCTGRVKESSSIKVHKIFVQMPNNCRPWSSCYNFSLSVLIKDQHSIILWGTIFVKINYQIAEVMMINSLNIFAHFSTSTWKMIGQWCKYYQVVCYPLHYDLMSRFSANDQIKTLEAGILVFFCPFLMRNFVKLLFNLDSKYVSIGKRILLGINSPDKMFEHVKAFKGWCYK